MRTYILNKLERFPKLYSFLLKYKNDLILIIILLTLLDIALLYYGCHYGNYSPKTLLTLWITFIILII